MYARKIPLLQVVKYLPKSVEWQAAAQLDYQADTGRQLLNLQTATAVIEGESLPELPAEAPQEQQKPPTRMTEVFGLLGWNIETQAKWCKANESLSIEEQTAMLEAELDK